MSKNQNVDEIDLTNAWKNGKLEEGFYYVKIPSGNTEICSDFALARYKLTNDGDKIEILAPVPSYEEYLESESHCAVYSEINKSLKDQIADLSKKVEKYDSLKVNGNYPDKISNLKSKIKHLTDLQVNQDKEIERLQAENEELKRFDGKNVCLENERLSLKVEELIKVLKKCHYHIVNTPIYDQGSELKQKEIHLLLDTIESAIGESEE